MPAIVDTGPLVAFFDKSERYHVWATKRIEELEAPLLVCEPVLAETMYLLSSFPMTQDVLCGLLQNGALKIAFQLEQHIAAVRGLIRKYRNVPMSLADACVVRMAEIHQHNTILTLDADFLVYRKRGRIPLMVMHPSIT